MRHFKKRNGPPYKQVSNSKSKVWLQTSDFFLRIFNLKVRSSKWIKFWCKMPSRSVICSAKGLSSILLKWRPCFLIPPKKSLFTVFLWQNESEHELQPTACRLASGFHPLPLPMNNSILVFVFTENTSEFRIIGKRIRTQPTNLPFTINYSFCKLSSFEII